ncbi:Cytochrome c, mono-and diheme variants [Roseivivax lentus]|uniref:Cytochrome c, mono-and diheme variants n=1 Tax=Roseivivax lentus TaxID=633194 RepID=A0A1N7MPV1_9RHOB|nr:cytochrome c [Roseivivax lentus]SIS88137.1 Cytochrome c, mono-and diheme variants [Roseivivax lentus]
MLRKLTSLAAIVLVTGGAGLWLTKPRTVASEVYAGLTGDAARGATTFTAAGCASCHYAPDAEGEAKRVLSGGQAFKTEFGTFHAPNISPHPQAGIGDWSLTEFASAVRLGTAPEGHHYYPAFPYSSYIRLEPQQIADLWAHLQTLPESDVPSKPHDLGFPFSIRASLGGWKMLYLSEDWVMDDPATHELARGRELVEALGHCGECHTPRTALGGLDRKRWLDGAANPSGEGEIPGIAPAHLDWSSTDIAYYLETGFTPDFDSAGGHMVAVVDNFAALPAEDRAAVAAYLKALGE